MESHSESLNCVPTNLRSRLRTLLIKLATPFLGLAAYELLRTMLFQQLLPGFGWHGMIGLGIFTLVLIPIGIFQVLRLRGPQLIIDERGIESRHWQMGIIPWNAIREVSVVTMYGNEFLGVDLLDPDKYLQGASWWTRQGSRGLLKKGRPAIVISCEFLDHSLEEVLAFIQERRAELVPAAQFRDPGISSTSK
jgi:hypothetical protein